MCLKSQLISYQTHHLLQSWYESTYQTPLINNTSNTHIIYMCMCVYLFILKKTEEKVVGYGGKIGASSIYICKFAYKKKH